MLVEYSSNNSGGCWWLKDKDWYALEQAGWTVHWCKNNKGLFGGADKEGRWLGALATSASKEVDKPADAIREFETITRQDVAAEGCSCCGPPHCFSWTDANDHYHCANGSETLKYLYDNVPSNLSEACELLEGDW